MATMKYHFTKCNHIRCKSIFLVDPDEKPGNLGYLCPICSSKSERTHTVQCSSCQTIINFIYALPHEEKNIFYVSKCTNCVGTIEDEWEMEPIYSPESYI